MLMWVLMRVLMWVLMWGVDLGLMLRVECHALAVERRELKVRVGPTAG